MTETEFKATFLKMIKDEFPDCIIIRTDPCDIQGIPDTIVLHNDRWAALEFKKNSKAPYRPNQKYFVERMGSMSYASFVFPENSREVFREIQRSL